MIRWVLLFCLLEGLAAGAIYQFMLTKQGQHLQKHVAMLETAYAVVVNSYLLSTETLYNEAVNQPDILEIFRQGGESEGQARDLARGKLYRRLYPTYKRLKARNLKQFHFHLADGTSFLRFHRPERYGDPLFDVRLSLRLANEEQRPVSGFETGRIYSGFRYVFPVLQGDTHLGSVETSLSFQAIEEELAKVIPDSHFSLILRKEAVFSVLFEDEKSIYTPTPLHPAYVYEDLGIRGATPAYRQPLIQALNTKLGEYRELKASMERGRAFAVDVGHDGKDYAVTLAPVKDVAGKQTGYLVSYAEDPLLRTFSQEAQLQFAIGTVGLVLLMVFMYRNAESRHALRESQIRFAGIFNHAPVGIGVLNTDGYYLQVNPFFLDLLGYSWEELKTKRCLELNHPDYVAVSELLIKRIKRGELDQWNMDKRFVRKDGKVFWATHWMAALKDEHGQCRALICIVSDLTERKEAEEALHKLTRAVEQSHNTIFITDLGGNIEFINPAFTRTSGYTAEEVIGRNPRMLKSEHHPPEFYQNLWQTLLRGNTWQGEFYNKRKSGELFWESAIISPIKNDEGNTTHYLAIKEDITDRKQAELELQQKNSELTRLNQEKNEFLGIAAHDLKNPLSAIKGLAEEIQEDYEDMEAEEVVSDAGKIRIAAQHMFMLITNLLDVNAIEAGKINVTLTPEDVGVLVADTVEDYRSRAEKKNIRLDFHNQAGKCVIMLDGQVFHQVMDNLVSNAIKYSPPETVATVSLSRHDDWVRCEVRDQGPGLSPEDQTKLFGKFARLSPKPTGNEHSTGLGLFIVKKMVEAMQGTVRCESELGKGSAFIVEFPRERDGKF